MSITDWPLEERPREKLLAQGPAALSDAELLAIFLRTGTPGQTAVDLARSLLGAFGGLRTLLDASQERVCQEHGLGTAKYAQLQAVLEMARRHLHASLQRTDVLKNSPETRSYLTSHLRHRPNEVFACLFLDAQNRVISFDEIAQGTIDGVNVYLREVVRRALRHNAAGVILAHNHPSGDATPSQADKTLTRALSKALALIDVLVLDHIIIGDGQTTSLAEEGELMF